MSYSDALEFLYSFIDYERISSWKYNNDDFDPTRSLALLHALGDPHEKGRYIHVAGTNGKGSVVGMIASTLSLSGYHTGMYTSPHLLTFRERIRIDGKMISHAEVVDEVSRLKSAASGIEKLTFFEVWTALAFNHFVTQSTDIAVIETGLGGRLDSTNVLTPVVSVITSISYDHIGKLGNTLGEIAREKAGIIKPGIPVVSAPQPQEVMSVISETALKTNSELIIVGKDVEYHDTFKGIIYEGLNWNIPVENSKLTGAFQKENTAVALTALEVAAGNDLSILPETAQTGIERLVWPGRLQTVAEHPQVILDGACNIGAMTAVIKQISLINPKGKIVTVVGMCADKDNEGVLAVLANASDSIITTQVHNPRAVTPEKLASFIHGDIETYCVQEPSRAVKKAVDLAGIDGLVLVTGSLYLVSDLLRYYRFSTKTIY